MGSPGLSVIVVSFNGPRLLRGCLTSVVNQAIAEDAEVIVVANWSPTANDRQSFVADFPIVRWVTAPVDATVPLMRRLAMATSRAPVLALTEDDCEVASNWCRAILASHRTAGIAIGGAVEPGPYRRGLDWAVYLHDYGRFMLPLVDRATADLAGNNVSYKRRVIDSLPPSEPFYDVLVHQKWTREGQLLRQDGTLVVRQMNSWRWTHVTAAPFHHGRGYASKRFASRPWPWRAVAGLLALLLPVLSTARIMSTVAGRRRHVGHMVQALPWILIYAAAWALGESAGYLAGPGRSLAAWR